MLIGKDRRKRIAAQQMNMNKKGRILIVDNELNVLSETYSKLLLENFDVEATMDADEIIPRTLRFKPELIIVNNELPGFDGSAICNMAKEQFSIPIILLKEGYSNPSAKIDGCSADEVVYKPINHNQLLNIIYRLLVFV